MSESIRIYENGLGEFILEIRMEHLNWMPFGIFESEVQAEGGIPAALAKLKEMSDRRRIKRVVVEREV